MIPAENLTQKHDPRVPPTTTRSPDARRVIRRQRRTPPRRTPTGRARGTMQIRLALQPRRPWGGERHDAGDQAAAADDAEDLPFRHAIKVRRGIRPQTAERDVRVWRLM